uniref:Cilia- and flagella-associated protein 53 n=1 Tax=Aureoumbra lagunensis TaxID=44058 RepID=A0A7S3JZD5_9STRA
MERRRAKEARIEETMKHNAMITKTRSLAVWENRTLETIERSNKERRIREDNSRRQAEVTERQIKLNELYKKEEKMWREQIEQIEKKNNSAESRKEYLMNKARALQEEREAYRKNNVEDCYRRQFRLACDEARTRDSKALQELINAEREIQMQIKAQNNQMQAERDTAEEAYALKNSLAAFEKEDAARAANIRTGNSKVEFKSGLDKQIIEKRFRREQAKEKQYLQDQNELDELQAAVEAEKRKQQEIRNAARDEGKCVQQYNAESLIQRQKHAIKLKEQDSLLLAYALKQEEKATLFEAAKQQDEKMLNERYKSYLDGFEKQKEIDQANLNAERLCLENRIWDAKDKEQANQQKARQDLAATVRAGREYQLQQKQLNQEEVQRQRLEEIRQIQLEQNTMNAQEAEKLAQRKHTYQSHAAALKQQVLDKRKTNLVEKQAEFLDAKMQRKLAQDHELAVAKESGVARLYHPLKSGFWYS